MRTRLLLSLLLAASCVVPPQAATIATFHSPLGPIEVELLDEDKPVTVSNFIKYATSGRFLNQFVHRWEPGFVIQGGAYRVEERTNGFQITTVETFGTITNEYSVGDRFSNTYGTIAMARVQGQTNSATSQWFFNLGDNSRLDEVDEGFTVFGRVISGTNILNLFIPPPPAAGIHINTNLFPSLPVLSTNVTFNDLVYMNVTLRRDLDLQITKSIRGEHQVGWSTAAGVMNVLEYTTNLASGTWQAAASVLGTGARLQQAVPPGGSRFYRVKLSY